MKKKNKQRGFDVRVLLAFRRDGTWEITQVATLDYSVIDRAKPFSLQLRSIPAKRAVPVSNLITSEPSDETIEELIKGLMAIQQNRERARLGMPLKGKPIRG